MKKYKKHLSGAGTIETQILHSIQHLHLFHEHQSMLGHLGLDLR